MDDESTFAKWLELPKGEPVRFDALPILIAEAQHPGDSDQAALLRVAAEIHIEDWLQELVDSGELQPRNRIGMARHTFPLGRSLRESVFVPELDLAPLAEAFAIGIRFVNGKPGPMPAAPSPPPPSEAANLEPAPAGAAAPVPAAPTEAPEKRRERLLSWWEEETQERGKRGALERVTAREKENRATADRSNIGRGIKKAREERAAKVRAGALFHGLGN